MRLKPFLAIGTSALLLISISSAPSNAAQKPQLVKGQFGESISAIAKEISLDKNGQAQIIITGKGFDETVGIYLAYCLMPKAGMAPTPCGGGVNKSGIGGASYWISSNAPPYAANLAEPFRAGGRFSKKVEVSDRIGKIDCRKRKCALTVRSDHLREGDRSRDLFIPVTFKKRIKL
jgi:hypothetical protein